MHSFWKLRSVRILTLVLLAQAGLFYGFSRHENVPARRPLSQFSLDGTSWSMVQDVQLDAETLEVLKADDILSRVYQDRQDSAAATLFVA